MKKYRSKIRIFADIVETIDREGGEAKVTRILYGANLSYDRLVKYLKELERAGLVEEAVDRTGRTVYRLTPKGREFLFEYKKIERFIEAFGLKL